MIAADSSVVVDLLTGAATEERDALVQHLQNGTAVLAPITLTELLSDPSGGRGVAAILRDFVILPIADGYWERAGLLRAKVRQVGRKAALGDALIAQCCIDADVPLLTRDRDFKAYAQAGGLKLV